MKTCFGWATEPFSLTVIVAESSLASAIANTTPSLEIETERPSLSILFPNCSHWLVDVSSL